jgi:hypothetical protein
MQTHVYANDQEIACKAVGNDGTSPQAFPDPCWSPPAPTAGPVVIPYPNTCFAESITNGTSTVFIAGKEVGIEDKSYFATSIGNEPATQAFGKGVGTGVITGKAYFTQWSFDVIFEGYGVPRHKDLVSHNHGSMPSNTPLFPYLSRSIIWNHDCKKEEDRIARECAEEDKKSDTAKAIRSQSRLRRLLRPQPKPAKAGAWHWTDDHCDGLDVKLGLPEQALDYAKKMEEVFKRLPEELNIMESLKSELMTMATDAGAHALMKWGLKAGVKQLAGSSVPAIGNALMGLWSVVDGVIAIGDVNEIRQVATESLEQLNVLREKVGELQTMASEFENFSNLSPQEQLTKAQQLGTAGQDALATLNECVRARKCNLVPHTQKDRSRNVEPSDQGGCCKGQTGHHLVSGAAMKEACPAYNRSAHAIAPTVCVEGTTQQFGSHKRVHEKYAEATTAAVKGADGRMSMADTLDAAAESHMKAFPLSRCSKACILAQLKGHYDTHCANSRVLPGNRNGNPIQPAGPSTGGGF